MTTDDAIDLALDKLEKSTTDAEAFNWFLIAMDRGARYADCREAVCRFESQQRETWRR